MTALQTRCKSLRSSRKIASIVQTATDVDLKDKNEEQQLADNEDRSKDSETGEVADDDDNE